MEDRKIEYDFKMAKENVHFLSSKYRSLVKRRKHRGVRETDVTGNVTDSRINASANLVALVSPLAALAGLNSTAYWKQQVAWLVNSRFVCKLRLMQIRLKTISI